MISPLTRDDFKYMISRLIEYANDAIKLERENPDNPFYEGKWLAYYEVIDTLKNELEINEEDLSEFGLEDVDGMFFEHVNKPERK